MSVTEIKQAMGGWSLRLREDTPQEVLKALTFYGHIAILPGELPVALYGDALLASARYVGVYRGRDAQDDFTLKGSGMAYWLGDEDDKGDIHETPVALTAATFANSVRALLPPGGAVEEGTLNSVPGTYNGTHRYETARRAITYVTDTFGAEWRVNNNATLDAGTVAQLYVTTPKALLTRKGFGADLLRKALSGRMAMGTDVEDVTTRVVVLAEGEGSSIATGEANVATPYKDLHGNLLKVTRLVSESSTEASNADARAQLMLNRFTNARRGVQLSTDEYDVKGTFVVGDYLDVYDAENGFYDAAREVYWQGERINPMALRCVELTWPVPDGWTVGFRDIDGNWIDLSPYYVGESGDTTIVVGDLPRALASVGGEPVGVRPNLPDSAGAAPDTTIPAAPAIQDVSTGSYQPPNGEWTKAAIFVSWLQPLNSDGSVITDGGHYEIRYRVGSYIGYQVRWGMLGTTPPGAGYRWGELSGNRWGAPITEPVSTSGEWTTVYVAWGQTQTMITELTPGMEYELQIRAVDSANPPKRGPWSASTFVVASEDLFAPDVPAAPVVASSRIAIQVMHTLGKASGGLFNLQPDLVYLSVHVGGASTFLPDDVNMVGKLIANSGMIQGNIPAVGTFQIEQTDDVWVKVVAVDRAGNKSGPSEGVQASVELIDSAHISDLTASKITAGTIMANLLLAASIRTAESGARVEISGAGLEAFNGSGQKTFDVSSADGSVDIVGRLRTEIDGKGITINPGSIPDLTFKPSATDNNSIRMFSYTFDSGAAVQLGVEDTATHEADGGKLLLFRNGTILSHQPDFSGGVEKYLSIDWPFNNTFYGRGAWKSNFADPDSLMMINDYPTAAGAGGGLVIGYGATMTGKVCPIYSMLSSTDQYHRISTCNATSITILWSNAAVSHQLFLLAMRSAD